MDSDRNTDPNPDPDHGLDTDDVEKITHLLVGLVCITALVYFMFIELMNPELALSDRSFWVLVILSGSALALKDLQYLRQTGPGSGPGG